MDIELAMFQSKLVSMNRGQVGVTGSLLDLIKLVDAFKIIAKCAFMDCPGGVGKTFILNAIIHYCRATNLKVVATAYSGIAANLLLGGRTCHSQFNLTLHTDANSSSNSRVKPRSKLGRYLMAADVIIIDEASQLHKDHLQTIHNTLVDLYKAFNPQHPPTYDTPFAGKVFIFSGDFRQVLPIIKFGGRTSIVEKVIN